MMTTTINDSQIHAILSTDQGFALDEIAYALNVEEGLALAALTYMAKEGEIEKVEFPEGTFYFDIEIEERDEDVVGVFVDGTQVAATRHINL